MSYEEIAEFLNYEILISLCVGIEIIPRDKVLEFSAFSHWFEECLVSFGLSNEKVSEWADIAKEKIYQDEFPWALEMGPITKSMVRERVRYFRYKIENEGLLIKGKPYNLDQFCYQVGVNERRALARLWEKTFGMQDAYQRRFAKWNKLRSRFFNDHFPEAFFKYLNPKDVGEIKRFFP